MERNNDNWLILNFNLLGAFIALGMLSMSLWLAPINLATKGYWAIGVLMFGLSLVNFVKYRFDERLKQDRLQRLEDAKNEKLLEDYVSDTAV